MRKKLVLCSICLLALISSGCGTKVKLSDGKEVVASLEGKDFTAEELFDQLKSKYGSSVLTEMVDNYIIDSEIKDDKEYKSAAEAEIKSMKSYYKEQGQEWNEILSYYGYENDEAIVKAYINNAKKTDIVKNFLKKKVTEDEKKQYYEKEIYGKYKVKHILIKPDSNENSKEDEKKKAKEKALKEAKEVIKNLNDGKKWNDMVKKYSDDESTKKEEGNLPEFTKGEYVDEFFEATLDLKDGEYTKEPVESTYGYHIIYRVSATKKPAMKDAENDILEGIVTNRLSNDDNLANTTWIDIRKSYGFDIKDTTINKSYKKMISDQTKKTSEA